MKKMVLCYIILTNTITFTSLIIGLLIASYYDYKKRIIPNFIWKIMGIIGIVKIILIDWFYYNLYLEINPIFILFLISIQGLSFLLSISLSFIFYRIGIFGGADFKCAVIISLYILTTYDSLQLLNFFCQHCLRTSD